MDFFSFIEGLVAYGQEHLLFAAAAGVIFLYLLYRKPKMVLTLIGIGVVLLGIVSAISHMSGVGAGKKSEMVSTPETPDR